ncbi:MAG: minor capsid protein [Ilumatobacteraceae bacterium]
MALLDEVGAYLETEIGSLTLGTNLFLGRMPDDPDTCVTVYEYGGDAPVNTMGSDAMPPVEQPRIQILVRASGYSTARTLALSCWTAVEAILNENLSGTRYHRVSANQSPFPLERDSQDRVLFAQNFRVQKEL